MKMLLSFFLLFVLGIIGTTHYVYCQTPSKINTSYLYSDSPTVFFKCRYATNKDLNKVTINANFAFTTETKIDEFEISYKWINNYGTKINKTILIEKQYLKKDGDREYILSTQLDKPLSKQLLILKLFNKITSVIHIFFVDFHPRYIVPPSNILFYNAQDMPLNESFITTNQKFVVKAIDSTSQIKVRYISKESGRAKLPYISKTDIRRVKVDTTFFINTNIEQEFLKEGYYIFNQKDNAKGITTLKVESSEYPKLVHVDELIGPVEYIATDLEKKAIKLSNNTRIAFENFWLGLFPNKELSKKMIKKYYERVKLANLLFTNYRKGWKEDRGMIYIVFGSPDYVYFSERKEIWEYKKNSFSPKKNFTFRRIKDGYTRQKTVLFRSPSYEGLWKQKVKQWRKGKIIK